MVCTQKIINNKNVLEDMLKNKINNLLINKGYFINKNNSGYYVDVSINEGGRLKPSFLKVNKEEQKTNIEKVKIVTIVVKYQVQSKSESPIFLKNDFIKKEVVFYIDSFNFLEKVEMIINDFL